MFESRIALSLGLNSIRIRCDDRDSYSTLSEVGHIRIPLRYTFTAQKPLLNSSFRALNERSPSSLFYSNRCSEPSEIGRVFAVMGSEERIRIMQSLENGRMSVSVLANKVGLSVNETSYHLRNLRDSGLLTSERQGKEVFYKLSEQEAVEDLLYLVDSILSHSKHYE